MTTQVTTAPQQRAPNNGTQLAQPADALKNYLKAPTIVAELAKMLPEAHARRLIQQALSLAIQDDKLLGCTQRSILAGIVKAAELNLELSGPLGQCYLIPRKNWKTKVMEATFQVGYKGLLVLAFRSNMVNDFPIHAVYAKDIFDYQYGLHKTLIHKPCRDADRGEAIAYYACVSFRQGGSDFEVMTKPQVEAHRLKYSPPPADRQDRSAWATNFDEMAGKTVATKLAKRCPLSVEFQAAASYNEYGDTLGLRSHLAEAEVPPSRSDQILEALAGPAEQPEPEPTPAE